MAWKQLKTPNLDPYVYQNGKLLTSWLGYCLAYVQTAFGSGWAGTDAWQGWGMTKKKHQDRNFPKNVYFPIWFDGWWKGYRYGHVAIAYDNGSALKIWSSPITNKPYADTWVDIASVERNYGMTYVGWSEDIGNTNLIEWVADPAPAPEGGKLMTPNFIRRMYYVAQNRQPSQEEIDFHMAKSNPESFINGFGDDLLWKQLERERNAAYSERDNADTRAATATRELAEARAEIERLKKQTPAQGGKELTDEQKLAVDFVAAFRKVLK